MQEGKCPEQCSSGKHARSGDLLACLDFEAAIREVGTVLGGGPAHYVLAVSHLLDHFAIEDEGTRIACRNLDGHILVVKGEF